MYAVLNISFHRHAPNKSKCNDVFRELVCLLFGRAKVKEWLAAPGQDNVILSRWWGGERKRRGVGRRREGREMEIEKSDLTQIHTVQYQYVSLRYGNRGRSERLMFC